MKKIVIIVSVILSLSACQNTSKKEIKEPEKQEKSNENLVKKHEETATQWTLNQDMSSVHWTGYKMTEKVAVSGTFNTFSISGVNQGNDLHNILKNARIQINVNSIFSDEESRDKKLIEYLFGKMMETNYIEARVEKIDIDNKKIDINFHMNNHEKVIPMDLQIDDKSGQITMSGKIDLIKDFDASEPLYFLHTACEKEHTGKDGKSKTWSEVGIKAVLKFDKK